MVFPLRGNSQRAAPRPHPTLDLGPKDAAAPEAGPAGDSRQDWVQL